MPTIIKRYASEDAARRAIDALRAAALRPRQTRLLTARPLRNVRSEPVGGFAGPVGPDAPVGNFAGRVRTRGQATGSFATGSFGGDPDRQRQGSFGDAERIDIVTFKDDAERARITGYRGVRQLLRRAALDDDTVDRVVDELHRGQALVLVDVSERASGAAEAQLERMAKAA
jgi:hypothetical protein